MPSPEIMEFESLGEPGVEFQVSHARGVEELSRPFHFTITLGYPSSQSPDPKKIVQNEACFKMKIRSRSSSGTSIRKTHTLHGVVTSFERIRQENDYVICRVTFESLLSRLNLHRKSRTFPNKTAKDVILEVLQEEFDPGDIDQSRLQATYPRQESFSQEKESNLNFVQRLLEQYGITSFHMMENNDIRKLALLDNWESFQNVSDEVFYYNEPRPTRYASDEAWEEGVWDLTAKHKTIPSQVIVTDYNWRKTEYLKGQYPESADGNRIIHLPGEHFKTNKEGNHIAQLRYERFQTEETLFHGKSNIRELQPGTIRTITNWFHNEDKIRIIRIDHEFEQTTVFHRMEEGESFYQNSFVANPASAPFRPEQIAQKPIALPTYGFVDLGEQYSGLDKDGRYTIREPNHLTQGDMQKGKASRSFRRMHPNAGPNGSGNNHPLHNEAEVLLFPVGGDPDRKIIAGSLYNSKNPDIVNNQNSSQSVRRTAGGIEEIMEDSDGKKFYSLRVPHENTYLSMGADHHSDYSPPGVSVASQAGISMNAGGGVQITAGSPGHENGVSTQSAEAAKVHSTAAGVAAVAALACGIAADAAAGGVGAIAGITGDLAGFAGGVALPGVYVTAPGKASIIGKSEAILGALGSADVIALGPANIMSATSALVCGGVAAAIVGGGNVEAVANLGDVKIHAKYKGNVEIEAKKAVEIEAHTKNVDVKAMLKDIVLDAVKKDIRIGAHKNLTLMARTGWGRLSTKKELLLESVDTKKIELKAGNSTITLEENRITIKSPEVICSSSPDGKATGEATLKLSEKAPEAFWGFSKKKMATFADDQNSVVSKKTLFLMGQKDVKMDTPMFDKKKAKKEVGTDHEDS